MSDDLIRRSDVIKFLNDYLDDCYRVSRRKYEKTMLDAISMDFEAVITDIHAVEPKQGEWNPYYTEREHNNIYNCERCGMTREEAAKYIKSRCIGSTSERDGTQWSDAMWTAIEALSADRPTGEWIEMGQNENGTHNVKCNQCHYGYKMRGHAKSIDTERKYRFWPHCGVRMKGTDNA